MFEMENSAFYQFGLLPEICIHSLDEDQYSPMYIPREKCDNGHSDWIESTIQMFSNFDSPKRVHRCKICNDVRMSDHISIENDV